MGSMHKKDQAFSMREWCMPHMLARAACDAFVEKNPDFRAIDEVARGNFAKLGRRRF